MTRTTNLINYEIEQGVSPVNCCVRVRGVLGTRKTQFRIGFEQRALKPILQLLIIKQGKNLVTKDELTCLKVSVLLVTGDSVM